MAKIGKFSARNVNNKEEEKEKNNMKSRQKANINIYDRSMQIKKAFFTIPGITGNLSSEKSRKFNKRVAKKKKKENSPKKKKFTK